MCAILMLQGSICFSPLISNSGSVEPSTKIFQIDTPWTSDRSFNSQLRLRNHHRSGDGSLKRPRIVLLAVVIICSGTLEPVHDINSFALYVNTSKGHDIIRDSVGTLPGPSQSSGQTTSPISDRDPTASPRVMLSLKYRSCGRNYFKLQLFNILFCQCKF